MLTFSSKAERLDLLFVAAVIVPGLESRELSGTSGVPTVTAGFLNAKRGRTELLSKRAVRFTAVGSLFSLHDCAQTQNLVDLSLVGNGALARGSR